MKTFLNVIWYFPYFGFLLAIPMALIGLFWCCTIVGMPIGLGLLQIAKYLLMPHSYALVSKKEVYELKGKTQNPAWKVFSIIVSILYFPIGLMVALAYIMVALLNFCTILGIPNGLVIMKMLGALFNPVNKLCVPDVVAKHISGNRDQERLDNYLGRPTNTNAAPAQAATIPAPQPQPIDKSNEVRSYSDERVEEILANPSLYNAKLVDLCRNEKTIREKSVEIMPIAEGYETEKLNEISLNPDDYSEALVYCANIVLSRRQQAIAEEREKKRAEEERRRREEDERRRDETKKLLNKWKYPIIIAAVALIALLSSLWFTSDKRRYGIIEEAVAAKDYETVLDYAIKFDNPGSKYFDVANASGLWAASNSTVATEKGDEIRKRIENVMESGDPLRDHLYLTGYYCKYLYNKRSDSAPQLSRIAVILENSSAENAAYSAATAYFLDKNYDKAVELFENIAMEEGTPEAFAYLSALNIFGLCQNFSRETGWQYLDNASRVGMYALLQGDKALRTDGSYQSRLQNARQAYDRAYLDNPMLNNMLEGRKYIVENCYKNMRDYGYTFNGGRYVGQETFKGNSTGANGWGFFSWKNGEVKFGKFKYDYPDINDVECTLSVRPVGQEVLSVLYDLNKDNNFVINSDGSISTRLYYYQFNPEWYLVPGSIFEANYKIGETYI